MFDFANFFDSEDDEDSNTEGEEEEEDDDDVLCDMRSDCGQRSPDNDDNKSRFTEYSMTSSVIRRNAQLSLLDDRFEQVFFFHMNVFPRILADSVVHALLFCR